MRSSTNTNLAVEYKEKDKAKALGARWNPEERVWYVPAGLDLEPFAPWMPGDASTKTSGKPSNPSPLSPAGEATVPYAKRRGKLYDPADPEPFAVSRTKIDLFVDCPRCFYLDRRLGIQRPSGPPFLLNSAVDQLFKNEFDAYRSRKEPHPVMAGLGRNVLPLRHADLGEWQENFKGVRVHHERTNFVLFGAVDDIWEDQDTGQYLVVDYKSTAKKDEVTPDNVWPGYWRQIEFYQYLVRGLGHNVDPLGCIVSANGDKKRSSFDATLHFNVKLITRDCDDGWVDTAVTGAHAALQQERPPPQNASCDYCAYRSESISE